MMHDALSMVRLRGEVRAVKSRKRLIFVLLCTVLCLFLYAFAFAEGYTVEEDGSKWYDDGHIEWADGTVTQSVNHDQGQSYDSGSGSSGSGTVKNEDGSIKPVHCTYDPESRGGNAPDGRKVRGTIHWAGPDFVKSEVRLYDRLFNAEDPASLSDEEFESAINPESLVICKDCLVEPDAANAETGSAFQFMRTGYFCVDPDSKTGAPVFNRTVPLNSSWK